MNTIMLGAAIAASLVSAPASAVQRDQKEVVRITVSTKGYDLTRPHDVARFRDKVDRQIRLACANPSTSNFMAPLDDVCLTSMRENAERQVDHQVRLVQRRADGANGG